MPLDIVLVRHGLAESGQNVVYDEDRKLLPEGVEALKQHYPQTFSLLPTNPRTQLWVSSAVRTRQTAEVIREVTGIVETVYSQFLLVQNMEEMLKAFCETDLDSIVVVGHVPLQERLCEHFTGSRLRFEPGAVACVRIPNEARRYISRATRPVGDLLWFVQGPKPTVTPDTSA